MKVAGAEPITDLEVLMARRIVGFTAPAAVPLTHDRDCFKCSLHGMGSSVSHDTVGSGGSVHDSAVPVPVECSIVSPRRPHDASELVRQGDSGFVVTTAPLGLEDPGLYSRQRTVGTCGTPGREKRGTSGVNKQRPQVHVTSLADATQASSLAR